MFIRDISSDFVRLHFNLFRFLFTNLPANYPPACVYVCVQNKAFTVYIPIVISILLGHLIYFCLVCALFWKKKKKRPCASVKQRKMLMCINSYSFTCALMLCAIYLLRLLSCLFCLFGFQFPFTFGLTLLPHIKHAHIIGNLIDRNHLFRARVFVSRINIHFLVCCVCVREIYFQSGPKMFDLSVFYCALLHLRSQIGVISHCVCFGVCVCVYVCVDGIEQFSVCVIIFNANFSQFDRCEQSTTCKHGK